MRLRTKIILGILGVILAATAFAVLAYRREHGGAMARVGIRSAKDIRAMGFEAMDTSKDPYQPTYWITSRARIARFYDALADPSMRIVGDYRIALTLRNRRMVLLNTDSLSQLAPRQSSTPQSQTLQLAELLRGQSDRNAIPPVEPIRIRYYAPRHKQEASLAADVDLRSHKRNREIKMLVRQLVGQFNSYSIGGVRKVDRASGGPDTRMARLDIKLSSPVSFSALVYPKIINLSSAPSTNIEFENITVDKVLVFKDEYAFGDRVAFSMIFMSADEPVDIVTRRLPRREIKGYDKHGNPIMGKDLFDELVKELMKTAK